MKNFKIFGIITAAVLLLAPASAMAKTNFSISLNLFDAIPMFVPPPRVIVAPPPPPPVFYRVPAPCPVVPYQTRTYVYHHYYPVPVPAQAPAQVYPDPCEPRYP